MDQLIRRSQPASLDAAQPSIARVPRQARGRERVEVILDAAAQLIAEEGLAAVTMHTLARRAQTSIGSMYHFFPDRLSVLMALCDRHHLAVNGLNRQVQGLDPSTWQDLPPIRLMQLLATPYIEYMQRHPDFFPLMHGQPTPDSDDAFIQTLRGVLEVRLPALEAGQRDAYATMMHSVAAGALHVAFQLTPRKMDFYLAEIPRVLGAYLAEIEAAAAP